PRRNAGAQARSIQSIPATSGCTPRQAGHRQTFEQSAMSREPYSKTIVTRWADIDCNQHMRNSAYSDWATYVRSEWLNEAGSDVRTMVAANLAPVLFEERTRFLKEILLGEHVAIDLQLAGF